MLEVDVFCKVFKKNLRTSDLAFWYKNNVVFNFGDGCLNQGYKLEAGLWRWMSIEIKVVIFLGGRAQSSRVVWYLPLKSIYYLVQFIDVEIRR